mmetsp:Transcript_127977/g.410026  ORF Transcript_127977/g.410026 Transcript_127977/m.410026 type:complete len:106 (-) Transcript_127977:57-374(-)
MASPGSAPRSSPGRPPCPSSGGTSGSSPGDGSMLDLHGLCIAKVNDKLIIESLDVYYSPDDLLTPLTTKVKRGEGEIPVGGEEADAKKVGALGCTASATSGCGIM